MPQPETSFKYPCYKEFLQLLGRFDAICSFATLAVNRLTDSLRQEENPREWLSSTAKAHGLILHQVELKHLPVSLAEMYIVLVHAEFERFVERLNNQHLKSVQWSPRKDKQSKLEWCLVELGARYDSATKTDFAILEYYRLVRNRIAHSEKDFASRHKNVHEVLGSTTGAPNMPTALTYADYNMFTRAAKRMAGTICCFARPSDREIADHVSHKFKQLNRLKLKPSRFRNAMRQKLMMVFQLDASEADPIIAMLIER